VASEEQRDRLQSKQLLFPPASLSPHAVSATSPDMSMAPVLAAPSPWLYLPRTLYSLERLNLRRAPVNMTCGYREVDPGEMSTRSGPRTRVSAGGRPGRPWSRSPLHRGLCYANRCGCYGPAHSVGLRSQPSGPSVVMVARYTSPIPPTADAGEDYVNTEGPGMLAKSRVSLRARRCETARP
jgi:hypothetical protein